MYEEYIVWRICILMLRWKGLRERKGDLCQGIICIQHIIEMLVFSKLLMIKNAISLQTSTGYEVCLRLISVLTDLTYTSLC